MQGKVVILTGNKRAGKTTLANKLNKEYNFTHLNMDQILDAVDYVCDKKNLKHFIDCYDFLEKLVAFAVDNAKNYGENTVIEYIFKISDVKKIQKKYNVLAYALYTDTDEKNLRKILKEYSKEFDWPILVGENDFNRNIKEILDLNERLKEECMNSKIKLIDTSYGKNRDVIIDKLSKEIGKN
mgnify:FL=1